MDDVPDQGMTRKKGSASNENPSSQPTQSTDWAYLNCIALGGAAVMIARAAVWLPILVLAVALSVGASFWFDILGDVVSEGVDPSREGPTLGGDFATFRLAGQQVVNENPGALYVLDAEGILGPSGFRNPPFYALFMVPFAVIGFMSGYLVWTLIGALCLAVGLLLLGVRYPFVWFTGILFSMAGLLNLFYGQNSFLTFLLLSGSYASLKAGREVIGGSLIGVVAYKPQLLGGFLVWLVARHRTMWKVIGGIALSLGALVAISLLLIPEAWPQFVDKILTTDPDISNAPVHLTLRHTALLLLPQHQILALVLYVAVVAGVVAGQIWFLRRIGDDLELAFAAAVSVSILIAPRGLAYDWILLAIPLGLVWTRQPDRWKNWLSLTAALVAAVLISVPLAKWQVDEIGVAIQVAPVVLLVGLILAARTIVGKPPGATTSADLESTEVNPHHHGEHLGSTLPL